MSDILNPNIFNAHKSDYLNTPLFLGDKPGLADTINRPHIKLFNLYKQLKANDWDELEFDFTPCLAEFKHHPNNIVEAMLFSLGWQWEADTIAARTISAITAPFVTYTDLRCLWGRIADNEEIHAATYSEIVKQSFDDPQSAMEMIIGLNEAQERSQVVAKIMNDTYILSHKLALDEVPKDQNTYNQIFLFVVAVWCLERIQFMSSFSITFALGQSKYFVPIAKGVQKILKDEWEIHVLTGQAVLEIELATERGLMANFHLRETIKQLIDDVVMQEIKWTQFMFKDRQIPLLTERRVIRWILYMAKPIYDFFGFKIEDYPYDIAYEEINENPLPWMKNWMNLNQVQGAAQEEKLGNYLLGMVKQDLGNAKFNTEGLLLS